MRVPAHVRLLLVILLVAPAASSQIDLDVVAIDASALVFDAQSLTAAGQVTASVTNLGSAAAGAFHVAFFEDLNQDDAYVGGIDRDLGAVGVPGLAAGASTQVMVTIASPMLFRGSHIRAFADAGGLVAESDEGNNVGHSGEGCVYVPPSGGMLTPQLEWSWTSSATLPTSLNVMSTPSVIDLDGDGAPEVIFGSTSGTSGANVQVGHLRVLSGASGAELFTVLSHAIDASCSIATGDLDGDGRPEIVAAAASNDRLLCFEHDGAFKWQSAIVQAPGWGSIGIADLDADGSPEIVVGRQALDASGALLWTGVGGNGGYVDAPMSFAADVDLDGFLEVVAGHTVYDGDGSILWHQPTIPDGYDAVGNFDADPHPEIVHVAGGHVRLLDHLGAVVWGPVPIPGGGFGGPPTVADFDGDGLAEIGVAGATRYAMFQADGSLGWQTPVQDASSNRTGSSVFDFDGDGAAEVVYSDEQSLLVMRGIDGVVVWQTPLSSCTWHEYALVADVDADGNAEILAVANDNCGFGPDRGVYLFGDVLDDWVATRPLWNQYGYHITNVNDDGTIPAVESANWLVPLGAPYNSFRQNVLTTAGALAAPNLTASWMRFGCTTMPAVTVRVGNGGAVLAGAGVVVSFYEGDPDLGGTLLGTVSTTGALAPGAFEDVTLALPAAFFTAAEIFAVVDDAGGGLGAVNECDESDNAHARAFESCATAATATVYGSGWPGFLGIPAISASAPPVLGTTFVLGFANARGTATDSALLLGFAPLAQPTPLGATLLVAFSAAEGFYLPVTGLALPVAVPCDVDLCGAAIYVQGVHWDPAASASYAFTPGLQLVLGE